MMERKILFRGKRTDDGEWVYGIPAHFRKIDNVVRVTTIPELDGEHVMSECVCVAPDTVGEFIGMTDKNGVRIFEGDILRSVGRCGTLYSEVRIGDCLPGVLREYERENGLEPRRTIAPHCIFASGEEALLIIGSDGTAKTAEVVGNVHDNPSLLNA